MPHLLILNGPNLNLLGTREPGTYGTRTLGDIRRMCEERAEALGATVDFRQSNHEGALVDWIQEAVTGEHAADGIIINPAAYTHTSIAIRDALLAVGLPFIEVHLSDIHAREPFRRHSYLSDIATDVLCGHGAEGYVMAVERLIAKIG